ncbi:dTDP-4-keto-6-deoxy-D-glucose epimerase [Caldichromatium japonicum]|uniref:dTDP-4-dehydrorhamnose 3,5-epimerase n=2 Tax=Caldichromatium japonicum TaxID=2699430 RepID=A0A6G7VGN8_9GAMM|nr:dTDP-4-keto-6-deoxy-D-glucose epimerase [Caldichromatium japonicum]
MSQRLRLQPTSIDGVVVIERQPIEDQRGWFDRLFCALELEPITGGKPIVQVNRSLTRRRGTVRGLHFQYPPHAEIKIVTCLQGEIFDVAVDLRAGSPSFLGWHAMRLSGENRRMLVIPEGCAHGFQTLSDDCELLYLHTSAYAPAAEGGFHPADPRLAIPWPLPLGDLSDRDRTLPYIDQGFGGVNL